MDNASWHFLTAVCHHWPCCDTRNGHHYSTCGYTGWGKI